MIIITIWVENFPIYGRQIRPIFLLENIAMRDKYLTAIRITEFGHRN